MGALVRRNGVSLASAIARDGPLVLCLLVWAATICIGSPPQAPLVSGSFLADMVRVQTRLLLFAFLACSSVAVFLLSHVGP